jgi:hypothetical protein
MSVQCANNSATPLPPDDKGRNAGVACCWGKRRRAAAEITGVPLGTVMSDVGRGYVSYA